MQGLTARYEERKYKEMDFNFSRLKQFELHVASESYLNPSDIASFLKKCPRVERVSIDVKKLILKLSSFFLFSILINCFCSWGRMHLGMVLTGIYMGGNI